MITNSEINKFNSILVIGFGKTNKHLLDIVRPENYDEAVEIFGETDLTESFRILTEMGAPEIYLMNLERTYDFVSAADIIKEHNFAYIVPLFYASEYFYNVLAQGKKTYYVQYLLDKFYRDINNESVIIATDARANLYKDLDAFLKDMNRRIRAIKANLRSGERYENLLFVANQFTEIQFANVYLAGMIVTTPYDQYPHYEHLGSDLDTIKNNDVTFWIDREDISTELIYFKKHTDNSITVENLLDMYQGEKSLLKIFFILRILKYINLNLDYFEVIGKFYSEYYRKRVEDLAEVFFQSIMGHYIIDYRISKAYAREAGTGAVNLYLKCAVQPINCTEWYEIDKQVNR